eukprot:TRINITY_DN20994_c0_g1_i1.p1 TRINITY_DN20994_c0_g1~~TRINITY_DN20994_c0_g1_i1.p1  ORF type:complete len:316 (+),score=64.33 TRINITY_DN20994_c0_g1_i1:67-948(+)
MEANSWLSALNVPDEVKSKLVSEMIDEESFRMLEESDLKELGIPLGPRKVLLKAIASPPQKSPAVVASPPVSVPAPAATNKSEATTATKSGAPESEAEKRRKVELEDGLVCSNAATIKTIDDTNGVGRTVEFLCPNVGLDMNGVKALLGKALSAKLDFPSEENLSPFNFPVQFAYDEDSMQFRNAVYLTFTSNAAAVDVVKVLNNSVFLSTDLKHAVTSRGVHSYSGGSTAKIVYRPPFGKVKRVEGEEDAGGKKGGGKKGKKGKGKKGGKKGKKGAKGQDEDRVNAEDYSFF